MKPDYFPLPFPFKPGAHEDLTLHSVWMEGRRSVTAQFPRQPSWHSCQDVSFVSLQSILVFGFLLLCLLVPRPFFNALVEFLQIALWGAVCLAQMHTRTVYILQGKQTGQCKLDVLRASHQLGTVQGPVASVVPTTQSVCLSVCLLCFYLTFLPHQRGPKTANNFLKKD